MKNITCNFYLLIDDLDVSPESHYIIEKEEYIGFQDQ